uniref:Transposable element Tc3 transposase n=1 Tax=Heterorhabditis bacteriophora TaxID=37862 RepID=A0A1I7WWK5_HETBA
MSLISNQHIFAANIYLKQPDPRIRYSFPLKNWRARVEFAREHLTWSTADWTKVVFSDESKFNHFGLDGKKYMHRRLGEEFMPKCTIPTIKNGGGSVMVWAGLQ